jgi:hypothetical protein
MDPLRRNRNPLIKLNKSVSNKSIGKQILVGLLVILIITGIVVGIVYGLKRKEKIIKTEKELKEFKKEERIIIEKQLIEKKQQEEKEKEEEEQKQQEEQEQKEAKELENSKEVYSVMKNQWTYDDAEYVCKALGSELASYEQLVEAAKDGAHWCNMGWIKTNKVGEDDGLRLAHFPVQRDLYNKHRVDNPKSKDKCGRVFNNNSNPEFNDTPYALQGGKFNKYSTFGVNCYGIKRPISDDEKHLLYQKEEIDLEGQQRLEDVKARMGDGLLYNLYSNYKWSRFNNDDDDDADTNTEVAVDADNTVNLVENNNEPVNNINSNNVNEINISNPLNN